MIYAEAYVIVNRVPVPGSGSKPAKNGGTPTYSILGRP
jgi:hypothetical protein